MDQSTRELLRSVFNSNNIIMIMLVAFLIFIVVLVILAIRIKNKQQREEDEHTEGHYVSKGIATYMPLGFAISIPIGIATKNMPIAIALGPALGLALGLVIGSKQEKSHVKEMRPLTDDEIKLKKTAQIMLIILVLFGFALFGITFYIVQ